MGGLLGKPLHCVQKLRTVGLEDELLGDGFKTKKRQQFKRNG